MRYATFVDQDAYDLLRGYAQDSAEDMAYVASELLTWAIETKRERLWDEQPQARIDVTP